MDVTHLGSSSPVSVHVHWTPFVGGRLRGRPPSFVFVGRCSSSFVSSRLHSRAVVPLVWCGGGPLVVGCGGSLWPFTHINDLDGDDGMRRRRLDDVAHLPRRLHPLSGDVALPRCCCLRLCVLWGW